VEKPLLNLVERGFSLLTMVVSKRAIACFRRARRTTKKADHEEKWGRFYFLFKNSKNSYVP